MEAAVVLIRADRHVIPKAARQVAEIEGVAETLVAFRVYSNRDMGAAYEMFD